MSANKVATKADLKEMYDRMLPYLGGMPEMLANKFSKGDLYSTDEKMIGQWIDGKPLYQKTIVKNNFTIGNDTSFTHGITNVDKIFIKEGFLDDNGSFVMMPLLWSTSYDGVLIDATKIVFKGTGTWGAQSTRTIYFIIQYTKTIDSAISIGSDTDYSTDEKIVGTWINGKPIYQKTLPFTMPANGATPIDLTSLNLKDFIDARGWHFNEQYSGLIPTPINNNKACFVFYDKINNRLYIYNDFADYGGRTGYLTIQYTKTT